MVNITPRPLYPRERDQVRIVQEPGWVSVPVWAGAESLASTGIRSPDRPARGKSLYRLSHPGPQLMDKVSQELRSLLRDLISDILCQKRHIHVGLICNGSGVMSF